MFHNLFSQFKCFYCLIIQRPKKAHISLFNCNVMKCFFAFIKFLSLNRTVFFFCLLSSVFYLLSSFFCLLSSFFCLLSSVFHPLSSVFCLPSSVLCLLSSFFRPLSSVFHIPYFIVVVSSQNVLTEHRAQQTPYC